ncbi:MAG: tRNA-dihydrouridine synthase [Thermoplasmata archaeon]|jgi:nifR3 family TIM-barrel protein|nr:tRNA-dihydrouridine synthase [Thermoplasmata archaeon]
MRIGGRSLQHPLVLSPMVDVTDAAFRSIAAEHGADVTCSEMVAAIGLMHGSEGAWRHLAPWPGESPYGVQFMCAEPTEMTAAIVSLAPRVQPDFVDVNLGCPAPNILRSCAGGFLMRDPERAGAVLRAARKAADEAGIRQVSAKMRLGPSANRLTYLEVARQAEDAGCDWVTMHARTVEQGYSGEAQWSHIAELVRGVGLPVVGNGDLRTPDDVVRMRDTTGCAGFFVARAAMHDPTVFTRMRAALDGRAPGPAPTLPQRLATLLLYLERAEQAGLTRIGDLRRQATRFVAGTPGARRLRLALQSAPDAAAIRAAVAVAA